MTVRYEYIQYNDITESTHVMEVTSNHCGYFQLWRLLQTMYGNFLPSPLQYVSKISRSIALKVFSCPNHRSASSSKSSHSRWACPTNCLNVCATGVWSDHRLECLSRCCVRALFLVLRAHKFVLHRSQMDAGFDRH